MVDIISGNNIFNKIKYLLFFVSKAFLIALFCCFILVLFTIIFYYIDLNLNVKNGNYKNPVFNGYVIVSNSMVPTIDVDDAILVKREKNNSYNIGDIISFSSSDSRYEGLIITHRIVGIDDSNYSFITKGDNNLIQDKSPVLADNIYGKVVFRIPKFGLIQRFLRNPTNFCICILFPVIIVLIYDGFRIYKALKYRI